MRVRVVGRTDADAVGLHLERYGCRVVEVVPEGLVVELPSASSQADAEAEVGLYLAMWRSVHPRTQAGVDDSRRPAA